MARGARVRTASILGLAAFALAAPALALRPQLFAIAIFALLLLLVARRHRNPRASGWRRSWWSPGATSTGPSSSRRSSSGTRGWTTSSAAGRPGRSFAMLVLGMAATLVNPVRGGRLGVRGGDRRQPSHLRPGHRVAADDPVHHPGSAVLSVGRGCTLPWRSAGVRGCGGRTGSGWATMFAIGVWAVRGLAWWPFGAVFVLGGLPDGLWPSSRSLAVRRASRVPATVAVSARRAGGCRPAVVAPR